jgi:Sulfotransferase domain
MAGNGKRVHRYRIGFSSNAVVSPSLRYREGASGKRAVDIVQSLRRDVPPHRNRQGLKKRPGVRVVAIGRKLPGKIHRRRLNMALQVIGAGLGRTGTVSLKVALEQLGIGRCYHMLEVIGTPGHTELWQDVADGRPDWEAIFADYGATADYPGCTCWRELAAFYPLAKVILSVRDPVSWFESTQATIFRPDTKATLAGARFAGVATLMHRVHPEMYDRAAMVAAFERHTRAVIDGIPRERLLVYRIEQGWDPLCAFLRVPIPDMPFPRANVRAEIDGIFARSTNADGTFNADRLQKMMTDNLPGRDPSNERS